MITFVNPCLEPFTFAEASSSNPAANSYDNSEISTVIKEFSVSPAWCQVDYTCEKVWFDGDENASVIDCNGFTFDAPTEGNDGKLAINASQSDYEN